MMFATWETHYPLAPEDMVSYGGWDSDLHKHFIDRKRRQWVSDNALATLAGRPEASWELWLKGQRESTTHCFGLWRTGSEDSAWIWGIFAPAGALAVGVFLILGWREAVGWRELLGWQHLRNWQRKRRAGASLLKLQEHPRPGDSIIDTPSGTLTVLGADGKRCVVISATGQRGGCGYVIDVEQGYAVHRQSTVPGAGDEGASD